MGMLNRFLEPLDLNDALEACIARCREEPVVASAENADLERLEWILVEFLDRLKGEDYSIWKVFRLMVVNDHGLKKRAMAAQQMGRLANVSSGAVLEAEIASVGLRASSIQRAKEFLPPTYRPECTGDERQMLRELLFLLDMLIDSLSPDGHDKVKWWHVPRAVGPACAQEVLDRLGRHPTSDDVYQVVRHNDRHALDALMARVLAQSRQVPPYKDPSEKDSAGQSHLWEVVHKKLSEPSTWPTRWARASSRFIKPVIPTLSMLQLAMDGEFDTVPYEVKLRFIDDARAASAQKRGGDGKQVLQFLPLTIGGEATSDREDLEGEEAPPAPQGSVMARETRDVWNRLTLTLRTEQLRTNKKLITQIGPAEKLLRFILDHQDDDFSDRQLAEALGVTDRTVRNYRKTLEFVRSWL